MNNVVSMQNPDSGKKYIEVASDGRVYITTATHDADGKPLPEATPGNIKRLIPQAADQLRAQGAARNPAPGSDAAKAAADERARISAILNLDHAKGRERLAEQLALTPDMSVERAGEILATAPAENSFAAIGSDPDEEARSAADGAISIARNGGYIR